MASGLHAEFAKTILRQFYLEAFARFGDELQTRVWTSGMYA